LELNSPIEPPFISADDPRYTDVEHTDNLPRYRRGRRADEPSSDSLDPTLARLLADHSPRLVISRSALVPSASSPTGWLLIEVVPDAE
jgi:hypothetical protein